MRNSFILLLIIAFVSSAGCTKKPVENQQAPEGSLTKNVTDTQQIPPDEKYKPLQIRLDELKQEWFRISNPKEIELVENAVAEMQAKEPARSMLQHDEKAPDFTLQDANGASIQLSTLLEKGPVVIVWFWGGWNPYCEITLQAFQEQYSRMKERDGTLLAISPTPPDSARAIAKRNALGYQLLCDKDNKVAGKYGVVCNIPKPLAELFQKKYSAGLMRSNDDVELPVTSVFVVNKSGIIRYSYANADYRFRAEPRESVDILDQLKQGILK